MKSLEQKLAESKAKLENLSSTKLAVDTKSVSIYVPPQLKDDNVYIPPFKRNHKEKAYVARLDKGKCSDIDADVFKPLSKPFVSIRNLFLCLPITFVALLVILDQIVLC